MFGNFEQPVKKTNWIMENTKLQLDEYFTGRRKSFDIKVFQEGSNFQKQVWDELLRIPFGTTVTYKELSIKMESDKSARAVGNANGKNKISIIVPCHRVIGTNGSLTGYFGGLDRKRWLLEHENRFK